MTHIILPVKSKDDVIEIKFQQKDKKEFETEQSPDHVLHVTRALACSRLYTTHKTFLGSQRTSNEQNWKLLVATGKQ